MVKSSKDSRKTNEGTAPDGGYGWVIVFAVFLQAAVIVNVLPFFDLLFGPKFKLFQSSDTEKSSVLAVFMTFTQVTILLVDPLGEVTSRRAVALLGAASQVAGLVIAAVATSNLHMVLGFGLLCGNGVGITMTNNIIVINQYFNKQKAGKALGLAAALMGVAGLLIPQILKVLISRFSTRTVILIYAAMCAATALPGAALVRPVTIYSEVEQQQDLGADGKTSTEKGNVFKKILTLIDWSLLKRPYFLYILTANSVCMTVLLLQLPELGLLADARQFSVAEKANLFTIIMTFDIFAKIAQGLIIDLPPIKRLFQFPMKFLYRFNAACMAVTMVGLALADSFIELSVLGCIVAFFNANIMINFSQILR